MLIARKTNLYIVSSRRRRVCENTRAHAHLCTDFLRSACLKTWTFWKLSKDCSLMSDVHSAKYPLFATREENTCCVIILTTPIRFLRGRRIVFQSSRYCFAYRHYAFPNQTKRKLFLSYRILSMSMSDLSCGYTSNSTH